MDQKENPNKFNIQEMAFFSWLFKERKNTVQCPRCLGKGKVDWDDIKRLNKELKWRPGKCAYCNGVGKVAPEMGSNVAVDETYLTTDLDMGERTRLINRDPEAIIRAIDHDKQLDDIIQHIIHLHFDLKLDVETIATHFLKSAPAMDAATYKKEKKELVDYINRAIALKV